MSGTKRWLRIIVISLLIGVLLGGGLTIARLFFPPGPDKLLKRGEQAYAQGEAAFKVGDGITAAARFDEANLQASKALDAMERERHKGSNQGAETQAALARVEGAGLWLKCRAQRDTYFARALAEGHPFPETTDPITGLVFRSPLYIPDQATLRTVLEYQRKSAFLLSDNAALVHQALLTETMLAARDWRTIEKLCQQALALNARDPWALYLLARFDYEQPSTAGRSTPSLKSKRSRARMLQARKYIDQLRSTDKYPLWRTLYLEAQIAQWLREDAAPNNGNRRDLEETALRALLFGSQGALARAQAGEALERPSKWDAEGVLGLHLMALSLAIEDSRQPGATNEKVVELLSATLGLCRQLAERDATRTDECARTAIDALSQAEPALVRGPPLEWKKHFDLAQELTRQAREQKLARPELYEALARLLAREAHLEGKRGNVDRRTELNRQALQWVETGLQAAAEAKMPAEQFVLLHALAAEMKLLSGARPEDLSVHLNALREAKSPRARPLVALLEAALAEREGRLVQARKLLEQVVASPESDLALRAHMVLGGVYLALGQPDLALASLQQVVQAYKVFDQLSPQEKAWSLEFVRGPENLALLLVAAHADSALAQLRRSAQRNPGKPVALDLVRHHENAIAELRRQLRRETPEDRQVRHILVNYYAATQRRDLAERELSELRLYYPSHIDVLRTEVNMMLTARDPSGKPVDRSAMFKDADARIEQFIKDHSADLDARYFRVEWLTRTQRVPEALASLQAATNFPDTQNERYQRVLAAVLLAQGDREGSQKVLEHLPHDAATDALLVQAASASDREKLVQQAVTRHENNALFQTWQAVLAFNKGDYPAAAQAFLRASQYHRYEATGKQGLLHALLNLAQSDPDRARSLAERLYRESPEEPVILLASAYAALRLDDIGTPSDLPDPVKSMASALNAWEQLLLRQPPLEPTSAPLTKAQFWTMAGRSDLALAEAARGLALDPRSIAALQQTILLALELRDPDQRVVTSKRLEMLLQKQPNHVNVRLLQARFDEWNEQPRKALAIYEDLIKHDPKQNEAYGRMISLLLQQGELERAREVVKQWREEQPSNLAAAQAQLRLLAQSKEPAQARKFAEKFIDEQLARERKQRESQKSAPLDARVLAQARFQLELQMAVALVRGKAYGEAEPWLQQLLVQHPDHLTVLTLLAEHYVAQASWDRARGIYEQILAKDSSQNGARNNLAWILVKYGNNAPEALKLAQEARKGRLSHKPLSGARLKPEFLDTLGLIYTRMNKASLYPEMRELFEEARQRYPHDPRMLLYLGHAYAGMQEPERAERVYASALEVARKTGRSYLSPEQCQEVITEVEAAQKKLKETVER